MPFEIEKHSGILIKKAARLFEQMANKNLDKLEVTYAQTIFLIRLWERDGQSQIDLAKSAGLKQPSVVRILDRMERDKLITRVRNTNDRRVFNFFLTEKAKKACGKLGDHADTLHSIATAKIAKKDIQQLNQLLLAVISNLETFLQSEPMK